MPDRKPVPRTVPDLVSEQVERLRQLFPEAFAEGRLDCEALRATIGEIVDDAPERYSFTWAGKRRSIELLQEPAWGTLVPDREQSVNFDDTHNIFIEGENLEVLKLLYRAYFGRVKMIYIDPPYNTGNDFVYPDNFAEPRETYLQLTGQRDAEGNLLTTNPETSGRYHSAWLSMMYPRLFLARQLLRDDGVICVSIGDEELPNLRLLLNEVFGEDNHRNTIAVRRYDKNLSRQFMEDGLFSLAVGFEHILVYSRTSEFAMNPVFRPASEERQATGYWKGFWNAPDRPTMRYSLLGVTPTTGQWKWREELAAEAVRNYEEFTKDSSDRMTLEEYWERTGKTKRFIRKNPNAAGGRNEGVEHWVPPSTGILRTSNWTDLLASESLSGLGLPFDNPKRVEVLALLVQMCTESDDTVLDFFAGSCSSAHAVYEQTQADESARKFIMVQLPEAIDEPQTLDDGTELRTIADIGRERIRRVIARLKEERAGKLEVEGGGEVDLGFRAFRLAESHLKPWPRDLPPEPEAVKAQMQEQLEPLREGWSEEGVIAEVALKEGFGLNYRLEEVEGVEGNRFYRVTAPDRGQTMIICLDERLDDEVWRELGLAKGTLFVCRDSAIDDTQAANLALHVELHTL